MCLFVGLVWFVNLVNFVDCIDWMSLAETVPVTGVIFLIGLLGGAERYPRWSWPRSLARSSALTLSTYYSEMRVIESSLA